jgi:hypothetical protein
VTVYTDCQAASQWLSKLRDDGLDEKRLRNHPFDRKLITGFPYLHHLGVEVELQPVPGHSNVEGNVRAGAAPRYAARNLDIGIGLDKGLRLTDAGASAFGHQQPKGAQRKGCMGISSARDVYTGPDKSDSSFET